MNDMVVGVVALFSLCFISGLMIYFYQNNNHNLSEAKIGSVYNFEYEQPVTGQAERYLAKVLQVSRLSQDSIARLNRISNYRKYDPNFQRTTHLVTAQTPDGKIRNFYAERTRGVRRPILGNVLFKTGLASMMF